MKSAYAAEELVPHAGRMCLLSRVVEYGNDWLRAEVDIGPDTMFVDERGVPAWVGLEYMAQTIAAYAGLQERIAGGLPKIGFLLGSRKYVSDGDYFERGECLSIRAEIEMVADNGLNVFKCELQGKNAQASAVVNVFQPEDAGKFLAGVMS